MITFLFIICFTLITILFYLNVLLFQRLSKVNELDKKQSEITQEIESILTSYIFEMKEVNDQFLTKLLDLEDKTKNSQYINSEKKLDTSKTGLNPVNSLSVQEKELTDEDVRKLLPSYKDDNLIEKTILNQTDNSSLGSPSTIETKKQSTTVIDQAHILEKQGLSVDEIAKKLNKGKTEIDLLLKFRRK